MALVFRGQTFFSVPEIAEKLGVTRLTVYRWLRGTRTGPDGLASAQTIRDTRTGQAYVPEAVVRKIRSVLVASRSRPRRRRRAPR